MIVKAFEKVNSSLFSIGRRSLLYFSRLSFAELRSNRIFESNKLLLLLGFK